MLLKTVLGLIGVYYMLLFLLPETICKELEASRANFFLGGDEDNQHMHWLKWDLILVNWQKGGLDIISLKDFNLALIQKWMWHFF